MGNLNHHSKASDSSVTNEGASPSDFAAKEADAGTLNPPTANHSQSNTSVPVQRWQGNKSIGTASAPGIDGLNHEKGKEEKEKKHHFWNKLFGKSDVSPVPIDHEGHAGQVPMGKPLNDGKLPKTAAKHHADQLDDGNLGQGLTWR